MTIDQDCEALGTALDVANAPELPKPNRHNLNFEFQTMPEGLRAEDPAGYQKLRFATMLDLLEFETGDLPAKTRHAMKAKAANFSNFLTNTRNGVRSEMPPAGKRLFNFWVDNLAAIGWNVLDFFFNAKDQRVFIHLLHLYNQGHITLPGCEKPLNECSFEDVVQAERIQEEQYWKELQRQGKFIALTVDDLQTGYDLFEPETLTAAHFKLARQAMDKAELIAYCAPDGRRFVLKDVHNVSGTNQPTMEEPTEQQEEILAGNPT